MIAFSKFNFFIPTKGGIIIFNPLYSTLVFIDKNSFTKIEKVIKEKRPIYDENIRQDIDKLKKLNLIVDESFDELIFFNYLHNKAKFRNDVLQVTILPTYDCNMSCIYCVQRDTHSPIYMTNEIAQQIVKWIKSRMSRNLYRQVALSFYGGEPLLNFKVIDLICGEIKDFCEDMGVSFRTSIITNGTLLTEEVIMKLSEYNIAYSQITIDGVKEVHDKRRPFRNGKGTFDIILENTEKFIELSASSNVLIRINIDKSNAERVPEFLDFLEEEGLKYKVGIDFARVIPPLGCATCPLDIFTEEEFAKIYIWLIDECIKRNFPFTWRIVSYYLACGANADWSIIIDPLGNFYKCLDMMGDEKYCVGNLKDGFNHKYYDWITRNPLEFDECRNCKILPICCGGCLRQAYSTKGTIHANYCSRLKYYAEDFIMRYTEQKYRRQIEKALKLSKEMVRRESQDTIHPSSIRMEESR